LCSRCPAMAKPDIDQQIQARIDSFTHELAELVKQAALDSISEALSGSLPAVRRGPGRPPRAGNGVAARPASRGFRPAEERGGKRSPAELEALTDRLLTYIEANPGHRTEQIGAALDLPTKELALPMRKLIREGHLKTKGQKRATTYYAK
jgi:hypothetical protein